MSKAFDEAWNLVSTETTYENKKAKIKRLAELEKLVTGIEKERFKDLWEAFIVESSLNAP